MNRIDKLSDLEGIIEGCLLENEDLSFCSELLLMLTMSSVNREWIEELCVEIINSHRDADLCGLAITCLGHLARIHGKINREKVMNVLKPLMKNAELSGRVEDTVSDIKIFTKNE